jgi:hypothetical protein
MAMQNALCKSMKSWIGLQGQTKIKKTNDLIKLSQRTRHWFTTSIDRSMEINTQKLGTASRISRCNQIENGQ